MFLLSNILPHRSFITTDGAYPIARGLKVQPRHSPLQEQFPVDTDSTLPLQESKDVRNRVLRGNLQAQVNVVGHRVPFQHLHLLLNTQIPQNSPDGSSQLAIQDLPTVFWDEHNMVLALPTDVRQRFKFLHTLFLLAKRGFQRLSVFYFSPTTTLAGTAEPDRVARP